VCADNFALSDYGAVVSGVNNVAGEHTGTMRNLPGTVALANVRAADPYAVVVSGVFNVVRHLPRGA
jgi:hypothetical protein